MNDVMIEAHKLTKRYGSVNAVRDVSFQVRRGEIVGFLGPNGAGKTTTMKVLTCFIAPTEGEAKVNNCDVFEDALGARRAVGYLPENTPLYHDMLTHEYLEFMGRMRGYSKKDVGPRIKRVVEATGLGDVVGKSIRELSKGYRQRVGLAQALIHEPPILILDEPMSGLDPNQAVEIRDLIKEIGKEHTVILSTHNLAEVQVTCNRVLIIAKGRIVADDTAEGLQARTGGARYMVSIAADSDGEKVDPNKVREALAKIDGAKAARQRSSEGDDLVFEVEPEGARDLRASISKAVGEAGAVLVGLKKEASDLEQVFHQLTTQEADEEPAEAAEGGEAAATAEAADAGDTEEADSGAETESAGAEAKDDKEA